MEGKLRIGPRSPEHPVLPGPLDDMSAVALLFVSLSPLPASHSLTPKCQTEGMGAKHPPSAPSAVTWPCSLVAEPSV